MKLPKGSPKLSLSKCPINNGVVITLVKENPKTLSMKFEAVLKMFSQEFN